MHVIGERFRMVAILGGTGWLLLTAIMLREPAPARGSTSWSPPLRLSAPDITAWFPGIAADASGAVHVFWAYSRVGSPGYDAVIYCPVAAQGCAERIPALIRDGTGGYYVTRPSPVVSPRGSLHLLWTRKGMVCHSMAPVTGSLGPTAWTRPYKLGDPASYNTLAIDRLGVLHAAWGQGIPQTPASPCAGCADIFYSRSADDGRSWSIPRNLSQTADGSEKPQIAFGADGSVYIAWEEGKDHYAGKGKPLGSMLVASPDGGETWNAPVRFEGDGHVPHSIAVGVDAQRRVMVVWQEANGRDVFWQISTDRGTSWSNPTRMEGIIGRSMWNKLDDYQMAPDAAGHLHLVLAGRYEAEGSQKSPNHVFHLEWDGNAWSAPISLFTTDGAPEWPRISVGNGNQIHAVWFERTAGYEWDTKNGIYAVWYARATSSAPSTAPVPWPPSERPWLSINQLFRLIQSALAVAVLWTVIGVARRRDW